MLKKYYDLFLESKIELLLENKFAISKEFKNVLKKISDNYDNEISEIILEVLDEDRGELHYSQNYLDIVKDKDDMISFMSDKSFNKIETKVKKSEYFDLKGRSEIKIGRFVRQFLKFQEMYITDKDIEEFVNIWKSLISGKGEEFKIVSGSDIKKYYSYKTYANNEIGVLGGSCMKHDYCQSYFDIYTKNPDQCRMLILLDPIGKLIGRALVWKVFHKESDIKGFNPKWVMDRIYTTKDSDINKFKSYSDKEGWARREVLNNYDLESYFKFKFKGTTFRSKIIIELDRGGNFNDYPYLDTFAFYDTKSRMLSNSGIEPGDLILRDTQGSHDPCDICDGDGIDNDNEIDCRGCLGLYDHFIHKSI